MSSLNREDTKEDAFKAGGGHPHQPAATGASHRERRRRALLWAQQSGVFFALLALILLFSTMSDRFLVRGNLTIVALQIAVVGIVAIPGGKIGRAHV